MKTLLMLAAAAAATPAIKPAPAPSEVVAAAPASDWVAIAASDLLVMDLATGKRVVIQLMPPPFSQGWVGNIRKLAATKWWDGTSINRVQDNYVVQWGDATEKKALPTGLVNNQQEQYVFPADQRIMRILSDKQRLVTRVVATKPARINETRPIRMSDPYSAVGGHLIGWPIATGEGGIWPVHCYGMVGVGRDMPPDTGTGAELYTVIGHAPRHLDRNIALVGRVISGIEHLSSLPRGTGPLGFYEKPEERVTITSIRMGTEVKDLPRYEYLSTESKSFAAYADARANRRDPFFIQPAGGADICNIPVPVRVAK
jgi:cyclophilin family peptidyl-prolyl cis-trans isomerase